MFAESYGNIIQWIMSLISSSLCCSLRDKSGKEKITGTMFYPSSHQHKLGVTSDFLVRLLEVYTDVNEKINRSARFAVPKNFFDHSKAFLHTTLKFKMQFKGINGNVTIAASGLSLKGI